MSNFLTIALRNAGRGYRVIPLKGKDAFLKNWPELATTDEATVRSWAAKYPDANVGVCGGADLAIIDTDRLSRLIEVCGPRWAEWSQTYAVSSGRHDRAHFYYQATEEVLAWGNKRWKEQGIDGNIFEIKVKGALVVGEGSIHPDTGAVYTIIQDLPLIPFPAELVVLVKEHWSRQNPTGKRQWNLPVHDGEGRDDFLIQQAGKLRNIGASESVIRAHLAELNSDPAIMADPKGEEHLDRIAKSAARYDVPAPAPIILIGGRRPGEIVDTALPVIETGAEDTPDNWEPRLDLEPKDYIDLVALEITKGTPLPFSFARETLKMLMLAGVLDPPTLPWYKTLHMRQYVVLLSEEPGIGKGETWRRSVATLDKEGLLAQHMYEMIDGDGLGSPEYSVVRFGGEHKKPSTKPSEGRSGVTVQIVRPRNIVYYDEGKKLAQKDQASGSSGLVTMYTKLFDSNSHSTGSFKNGTAVVKQANVSLMLHFVREAFELTFAGTGVTADGFLSRCTFVVDYRSPLHGDWRIVDSASISGLMQKVRECMERKTLEIHPDADEARLAFVHEIRQWEPKFRSRLEFLFNQDLFARALFSPVGILDRGTVERAGKWTRHQYETRTQVYPLDVSPDKREQMGHTIRNALLKHGRLTRSQLMKFGNVHRVGSGGYTIFAQVFAAMGLKEVGKTRKGASIYALPE